MFIPQKTNDYSNVFTSVHQSASAAEAKLIAGQYHPLIRQFHLFADIYPDGGPGHFRGAQPGNAGKNDRHPQLSLRSPGRMTFFSCQRLPAIVKCTVSCYPLINREIQGHKNIHAQKGATYI